MIPVLLPLFTLIGSGLRGLDFGMHMDELPGQIWPIRTMLRSQTLLPPGYTYPSFDYWVTGAALIPEIFVAWPDETGSVLHFSSGRRVPRIVKRVFEAVESHAYLLRVRTVFLVITSLSVLWVYLIVLHWRQSWVEALLSSAFLSLSWEVAYHLRWVATDGMVMQFGALTLLFTLRSWLKRDGRLCLQLAAVSAGLACGAKYPGGLLLIPILATGYFTWDGKSYRSFIRSSAQLMVIFAGVYLLTTPGTLVQPLQFLRSTSTIMSVYSSGGGGGAQAIAPGLEHGWLMFIYFSSTLFSHYVPIAVLCFALCVIGTYALVRESRRTAALFLCFPSLYILYFSMQKMMMVRNLLVVAPFMATLAARGTVFFWEYLKLKSKTAVSIGRMEMNFCQACFAVAIIASLLVNTAWLIDAAESIVARHTDRFVRGTAAYISTKKGKLFFLSPHVRIHLSKLGLMQFPNVVDDPAQAQEVILYASEAMKSWIDWPGNRPRLIKTWFGPYEVNLDAYRAWTWRGDDRIIVMPIADAKEIGILVVGDRKTTAPSEAEINPCTLSKAEAEEIMGPLREEPKLGGVVGGGTACTYIGALPVIVNIGALHRTAFEVQKYNAGVTTITDLGDEAYSLEPNGLQDLFLFVRRNTTAIAVNVVTGVGEDLETRKYRIAQDFAKRGLDRLIKRRD